LLGMLDGDSVCETGSEAVCVMVLVGVSDGVSGVGDCVVADGGTAVLVGVSTVGSDVSGVELGILRLVGTIATALGVVTVEVESLAVEALVAAGIVAEAKAVAEAVAASVGDAVAGGVAASDARATCVGPDVGVCVTAGWRLCANITIALTIRMTTPTTYNQIGRLGDGTSSFFSGKVSVSRSCFSALGRDGELSCARLVGIELSDEMGIMYGSGGGSAQVLAATARINAWAICAPVA